MSDADCIAFLKWALPRLQMQWSGFRKVRGQACKRLRRRIVALALQGFAAYRERLETDPQEWHAVDACCRITISRFYRDKHVFDSLRVHALPKIAARARREGRGARCWSAGCASGEEPYTLKIVWDLDALTAGTTLSLLATDTDEGLLERARRGCYGTTSVRELPSDLIIRAFDRTDDRLRVRSRHRRGMSFLRQDLRSEAPSGGFDLVLCRNLAFTYFLPQLQQQLLLRLADRLLPSGILVIGAHEQLPASDRFTPHHAVPHAFYMVQA